MTRGAWVMLLPISAVTVAVVYLALWQPVFGFVILGIVALVIIGALTPGYLSPVLLVVGAFFIRPNVMSHDYAIIGLGFAVLSAFVAIVQDLGRKKSRSLSWVTVGWILVAFAGMFIALLARGELRDIDDVFRPVILMVGTLVAGVIVVAEKKRAASVARLFVIVISAFGVSYLTTLLLWLLIGSNALLLGGFSSSAYGMNYRIYFPFTLTLADFSLPNGLVLPRLTGIGREPGWMAMYAGVAFFLSSKVFRRAGWVKFFCLVALLCTFSTAGFAVFVVVVAYEVFLRRHSKLGEAATALLRLAGVGAIALASWFALFAPVIGVGAKAESDQYSVEQRSEATMAGLRVIFTSPITGGGAAEVVGGVNLIAAVALYGSVFSVAILLAIWWPMLKHNARGSVVSPLLIISLTLLTSQPPADSTWVYMLVIIVYAAMASGRSDVGGFESARSKTFAGTS